MNGALNTVMTCLIQASKLHGVSKDVVETLMTNIVVWTGKLKKTFKSTEDFLVFALWMILYNEYSINTRVIQVRLPQYLLNCLSHFN